MTTKNPTRRRVSSRPTRDRHRLRPTLTMLEDRQLLSFIVTNTADNGTGSLRYEIGLATSDTTDDTITFDPTVFNTAQTITLTSGQLNLAKATGTLTIQGPGANLLSVSGNNASRVFYLRGGSAAYLSGLTVTGAKTNYGGGLLNYDGTVTLTDCIVSGNSANIGGGLMTNVNGTTTLTNCTVSDNTASVAGGGIQNNEGSTTTLTNCTVTGNSANVGGGMQNYAPATLTNCTISGNSAIFGGGFENNNNAPATLTNCTISGNSASTKGGGLFSGSGTIMLTNCTVSGNSTSGQGGGLANVGTATLTNCTVSGNSAIFGGGLYNPGGPVTLTNTIIAANTATTAPDVAGAFNSDGNNLIGETDGSSGWVGSDLTGTIANPLNHLLAPLGNYGGPTQTMALLPGSPAIAGGASGAGIPTTDQRGKGRVGATDIGAFESQGFTIAVTSGSGQSTNVFAAFSAPLVATVTADNPVEPVAGGLVTFTAPASGASASLSVNPATIAATGTASVTAMANSIGGSYAVSAAASGITTAASFSLTNYKLVPTFSALASPTIVYGTSTTTLTGHIGSGTAYPTGSDVSITLNSVVQTAMVDGSGNFTTTFNTATLGVAGGPYTVTYAFAGNSSFSAASDTSTKLTVTLSPSGASIYVLDATAGGALNLSGNADINIGGSVVVDSSSSSAISASGNAAVTATSGVLVVGGVSKRGNASVTRTGTPGATGDPFASLPLPGAPSLTNYGSESVSGNSVATIGPGIYSQISVSGNAQLTMTAGTYIIGSGGFSASGNAVIKFGAGSYILEGGGLSVSGNAAISGTGVTIFNVGSSYNPSTGTDGGSFGAVTLSGNGTVSLTAPTSGTYTGILIYQARDNAKALTFSGNAMQGISGTIYAAAAQLTESGNAQIGSSSNPISIVVDTLTMSGNAIANVSLTAPAGTVAYTPAQIRAAYGISSLALDGTGQTIAIVEAYDDPSIFQSVDAFDTQFGLTSSGATLYQQYGPASSFLTVLNQSGQPTSLPGTDPNGAGTGNWELETALDVEWAHAVAPGAQIVLVEASSQSLSDLMAGVATAASQPGVSVVTMSWGFPDGQAVLAADEAAYDSVFNVPGVTFLASTGDYGTADPEYPAFSPNVVAVGGTTLNLNADQSYNSVTGWGYYANSLGMSIGSGGGLSMYESEPAYQQGVQSTGFRTTPDVSLVADPATGAWVADTYNLSTDNPFEVAGGTSLSAPAWAGLFALVNQGRVAAGEGTLNSSTPTDTQQALYRLPQSDYHVIASGSNGYTANTGYNLVTGLGTPVANLMVPDLIAYHGPGTSYAGPTVSRLQDATLSGGAWTNGGGTTNAFNVFSALTATGSGFSEVQSPAASLAMSRVAGVTTAPSLVNLTTTVTATTTSAAAIGSPFAVSVGSISLHEPAQSLGSTSNSTSAGMTSAPLAGVTSSLFSTGLTQHMTVWSTPGQAVSLPSAVEHQAVFSGMDRPNLYADAFVLARPRRELAADSVLDDVAANLLLSRGQDGAAPASAPALPPTGVTVALDATGPGLQLDQDVPSATSAAGLVVFGLARRLVGRTGHRHPGCP